MTPWRTRTAARTALALLMVLGAAGIGLAQTPARDVGVRGYGGAGLVVFSASETFDAVLGTRSLPTFGGGVDVLVGDHVFVGVGAWHASADGERVFVGPDGSVFPLGIPTTVTVTPVEVGGGWRFTGLSRRVVPYAGGGVTFMRYRETVDTGDAADDVTDTFTGLHLRGGAELRLKTWLGLAGEVVWTSVPGALGEGGASEAFGEENLGSTALRVTLVVGR